MGKDATTCKDAIAFWQTKGLEEGEEKKDPSTAEKVALMCMLPSIKKMDSKLQDLVACTHLSLSTNCIDRIQPLGLKNLKILSLGRNNIKKIEKLDDLGATLEELWISYNQIEKLDGLSNMRALRVIYMSNNNIKQFSEIEKLAGLPALEEILLLGNPIYDDPSIDGRKEVIKRLPKLKKLDGSVVSETEKQEALADG